MSWSQKGCTFCLFLNHSEWFRKSLSLCFGCIDIPFKIAKKQSVGLYFFILVLVILLFCHICKLNKLYVVKRFCILFKQSLWELIALVWHKVSDLKGEFIFFWKNLPYGKWIPIKQTKMAAQVVAGFYETSTKKLMYHHNVIQNRWSCVIP